MRKPEHTPEPSIEEILASIRKIIADDSSSAPQAVYDEQSHQADRIRPEPSHQRQSAYYDEDYNHSASSHEDEILELTEDFMVAEEKARVLDEPYLEPAKGFSEEERLLSQSGAPADARAAPGRSGNAQPEGRLENILSDVAAEVQRLTPESADEAERGQMKPVAPTPLRSTAPPLTAPIAKHASPAEEDDAFGKPPFGPEPPVKSAPRQLWSARRGEEGKQPLQRSAQPAEPALQSRATPPAPPVNPEPRVHDKWAQGVQMPVPESGPAVPFSHGRDEDEDEGFAGANEAMAKDADLERERSFVGEMLTRVFGGSGEKSAEKAPDNQPDEPDEEDDRSRAVKLAKSTIADFADEKLGAPAVAGALHADQPFMDAITNSISTALPNSQRNEPGDEPYAALKDDHTDENEPAQAEDEQPFGIPAAHLHGIPPFEMPLPSTGKPSRASEPHAFRASKAVEAEQETPELPSEEFQDMPEAMESPAGVPNFAVPPLQHAPLPFPPQREQRSEPPKTAETVQLRQERVAKRIEEFTADETSGSVEEPLRAERPAELPQAAASAPQPAASPSPQDPPAALTAASLPEGFDDQVKELLKPLIIQWLDKNMPRIVEQAVREEVAAKGLSRDKSNR